MSNVIDIISKKWSQKVGVIDKTNPEHVAVLNRMLLEMDIPFDLIQQSISVLVEDNHEKVKFKDPRTGDMRTITMDTARQYASDIKQGDTNPEKEAAVKAAGLGGEGEKEKQEKPQTKIPKNPMSMDTDVDDEEKDKKPKSKADDERDKIGGKSFTEPLETTDDKFVEKNFENKTTDAFTMPDSVKNNPKIPKKYTQFIERVMNTQKNTKDGTNYSSYYGVGKGGKGNTDSNAGELLSMMATTMRRDDRDEFFRTIDEHLQKTKARGEKIYVSPAWVKAAKENSSAVLRMMYDKYGKNYEIVAGAWDIKEEFESLGFDYGDKGYSTDIMFKVKVGDTMMKEEISLKQKLKNQRLWNGTIGSAFGAGLLPQHLEQGTGTVNQFSQNQIKNIDNFYQNNQANVNEFLGSVSDNDDYDETLKKVSKAMDNKESNQELIVNQFNEFLSQYKKDLSENPNLVLSRDYVKENIKSTTGKSPNKRAMDKVSITLGRMMEDYGDEMGGEFVKQQKKIAKEHARNVANFVNTSDEARDAVLKKVQEKLPLKSVSDGDESVVLGEYIINKKTMEGIFGTGDWNQVVEQLSVNPDANPPMIQYQGKVRGQDVVIPITTIGIREDGEGYGGSHKFEMTVAPNFDKYVESVSRDIFGDQEPIVFPDSPATLRRED